MGDKTAGMQVFFPVEPSALALEILQQAVESRAPVRRAEGQEKVIATDMPDKIPSGINSIIQALRQAQEHFVALGVAVDVAFRICEFFVQNEPLQFIEGVHCVQTGFI